MRRFVTSRPFVTVAELRRRFGLDDPDAMTLLRRNGTSAWIGLPEREAAKLQELWHRGELGVELSVEVRAPVVVGVYPMRIARYVMEASTGNGVHAAGEAYPAGNGHPMPPRTATPGQAPAQPERTQREHPHAPRQMFGAPSYAPDAGRLPSPDTGSG